MVRSFYGRLIRQAGGAGKRSILLMRLSSSLAIVGILVWWLSGEALLAAIAAIKPTTWVLVITGFIVGHIVSAFKWRLLLHAVKVEVSAFNAIRAHGAGLFANLCLPSVIGGDVIRAGLVMRQHKSYEQIALGSLADRVNDSFALVLLAAVASLAVPVTHELSVGRILSGAAVVLLFGILAGLLAVTLVPVSRLPIRVASIVMRVREALASLVAAPGLALLAFTLSVGIQAGFVMLNLLLARDIGIDASAALWFFAWPLAKLVAIVPVSLGGIGVREVAIAGLLVPFGLDAGQVVAQSLSWEGVLILSGLFAGLIVALLSGRESTGEHAID